MRRLLVLASAMIFFDVTFYAAIAPLLPDYTETFGIGEAGAGVLAAAYGAGTLIFALPGGLLAARFGPRRTAIVGLLILGGASVVFGFAGSIVVLDGSRFVQGVGGALVWAGALAWLIGAAPPERRGAVIGSALGIAIVGALVGPALGGLAAAIGTEIVFSGVMVFAALLAALATRLPEAEISERQALREVAAALFRRPLLVGAGLITVPSLVYGAVEVLVPLRLDELGSGHLLISAGFIAGAALEALVSPLAGRHSDRAGRRDPYVAGAVVCAGAMLGIGVAAQVGGVVAGLLVVSVGAGLCISPAMAALSEITERVHLHLGFAAGLSNMAWATGQVVGALLGGTLAGLAGFAAPNVAIAAMLLITGAFAFRVLPAVPAHYAPPR